MAYRKHKNGRIECFANIVSSNCHKCGGSGISFINCVSNTTNEHYIEEENCIYCQGTGFIDTTGRDIINETRDILAKYDLGRFSKCDF